MLIYLTTLLALVVLIATWKWRPDSANTVRAAFRDSAYKFSRTVFLVGLAFSGVQLILALQLTTSDTSLLHLERMLAGVRSYMSIFKLPPYVQLGALIILLGCGLQSARLSKLRLIGRFTKTTGYLAKLNFLLTLLTSMTFFGTGTLAGAASLEARLIGDISALERGYAAVHKEVRQIVIDQIAEQTLSDPSIQPLAQTAFRISRRAMEATAELRRKHPSFPSLAQYRSRASSLADVPKVYQIAADLTRTSDAIHALPSERANQASPPRDLWAAISSARNQTLQASLQKIRSAGMTDDAKIVLREALDATYSLPADPLVEMLAALDGDDIPGHLTKLLLGKLVSAPVKKMATDSAMSFLASIYQKELEPSVAVEALEAELATGVRQAVQLSPADVSQIESNIEETAKRLDDATARMIDESANFARSEGQRLVSESLQLARSVAFTDARAFQPVWDSILTQPLEPDSDPFKQLDRVVALHASVQKVSSASSAPDRITAAIAFERGLTGGQTMLAELQSIASEIESLEGIGHWGEMRRAAWEGIPAGRMRLTPEHQVEANQLVSDWFANRARYSMDAAKSGLTPDDFADGKWDHVFAAYALKNNNMTAIWGFIVISLEEDPTAFDEYIPEAAEKMRDAYIELHADEVIKATPGLNRATLTAYLHKHPELLPSADAFEAMAREHGAYPEGGFRRYMTSIGASSDLAAKKHFRRRPVQDAIDKFCPRAN